MWSLQAGSLTTGLTLSTAGVISGTPNAPGTSSFTVRATDSGAPQQFDDQVLSLNSVSALPRPGAFAKSSPRNAAKNLATSVALAWGASTNASSYEYCYDTSNNNTCNGNWVSTGSARTATASLLSRNTSYYWQVRAVNGAGTTLANSGTWWKFTTAR
jgi:hypothetical protein